MEAPGAEHAAYGAHMQCYCFLDVLTRLRGAYCGRYGGLQRHSCSSTVALSKDDDQEHKATEPAFIQQVQCDLLYVKWLECTLPVVTSTVDSEVRLTAMSAVLRKMPRRTLTLMM